MEKKRRFSNPRRKNSPQWDHAPTLDPLLVNSDPRFKLEAPKNLDLIKYSVDMLLALKSSELIKPFELPDNSFWRRPTGHKKLFTDNVSKYPDQSGSFGLRKQKESKWSEEEKSSGLDQIGRSVEEFENWKLKMRLTEKKKVGVLTPEEEQQLEAILSGRKVVKTKDQSNSFFGFGNDSTLEESLETEPGVDGESRFTGFFEQKETQSQPQVDKPVTPDAGLRILLMLKPQAPAPEPENANDLFFKGLLNKSTKPSESPIVSRPASQKGVRDEKQEPLNTPEPSQALPTVPNQFPGQFPPPFAQFPPQFAGQFGQIPPGQLPPGQVPPGQMPPGQMPPGQMPPQMSKGHLPQGQIPQGQIPPPGQFLPPGLRGPMPGQFPGQFPPMMGPPGQMPAQVPGQMPGQMPGQLPPGFPPFRNLPPGLGFRPENGHLPPWMQPGPSGPSQNGSPGQNGSPSQNQTQNSQNAPNGPPFMMRGPAGPNGSAGPAGPGGPGGPGGLGGPGQVPQNFIYGFPGMK